MNNVTRAIFLGVLAMLMWSLPALAMYTPNPAGRWEPNHFFLAGDFQYIGDKGLSIGTMHDIYGFYARPGYSVARNVVVYGRLGVQGSDDVDAGFAGGFGIQGAYVLPNAKEWAFGGSFDFLHWSGDFKHDGPDIDWNEFQFAPAVSYRIPRLPELTPYGGVLIDIVDGRGSIDQGDPAGMVFGTNYDPLPELRLEAQVRVVTETAFSMSVAYIF